MVNYYNAYKKWLDVTEVENKKWFFFKKTALKYDDKEYTKEQFMDSVVVLFDVLKKVEIQGYDIAIFYDEVRLEPNLRYKFHVPPIHISITKIDFPDHVFNKLEAIRLTIAVFTEKWTEYVKNK